MAVAPARSGSDVPEIFQTADPELAGVFEQAARIGVLSREEHLYSFTTLLAAIYYSSGPTCQWWHSYADSAGIKIENMLSGLGVRAEDLTRATPVSFSKQRLTTSASQLMEKADDMRQTMGETRLGVRHVLGS